MESVPLRRLAVILVMAATLGGCETETQVYAPAAAPAHTAPLPVRLEPCHDRTANSQRDLGGEATKLLQEKLRGGTPFTLSDNAAFVVSCEVTGFEEGSAFARWLLPGAGSTTAQMAAMVSSAADGTVQVIVQGNAVVAAGGLFTIGADQYILKGAVDDVFAKLVAWAEGRPANPR